MLAFICSRKDRISEVLKHAVPHDGTMRAKLQSTFVSSLNVLSIFGCSEHMDCHIGIERNGLGNVRVQLEGQREAIAMRYGYAKAAARHKQMSREACHKDIVEFCKDAIEALTQEDWEKLHEDVKVKDMCWRHVMEADEVMVL